MYMEKMLLTMKGEQRIHAQDWEGGAELDIVHIGVSFYCI
jgi:hypothetical protein